MTLNTLIQTELFNLQQASEWASSLLNKNVTPSNIAYLVQYGKIPKLGNNGSTLVSKTDLHHYYKSYLGRRETSWKAQLGDDLNWLLSFDHLKEADTTKHVHRLHPYKGKFIPQLVGYFLDSHLDDFKQEACFKPGDIVLDPFSGSGTTMVEASELGIHAIGIDVSAFNAMIANIKVSWFDLADVTLEMNRITEALRNYLIDSRTSEFDQEVSSALAKFNARYFPSPDFKRSIHLKEIDEDRYGAEKLAEFLPAYERLVAQYGIKLRQEKLGGFLGKWYLSCIRQEIDFVFSLAKQIAKPSTKALISLVLSRTIRSCRATTHSDLATLKEPITAPYYCAKHGKVCKPLFSILSWWSTYCKDTIKRVSDFDSLRTDTLQGCLAGDARTIDIVASLDAQKSQLANLVKTQRIRGIFSSPPYVGLIDYHEQHAYAYDLFGYERKDSQEIGAMRKGASKVAQQDYVQGIVDVLINSKKYLVDHYDVFLVANDKFNLYPQIADKAGMIIVNQFKRPVLNRTERDKSAYSETIFRLKERNL
jgi:hypothetical protein